jgi:YfiH family protein
MSFQADGELNYFQFDSLDRALRQAVFTRRGGVSPEPWASLNMGGTVGDDPHNVKENRQRGLAILGCDENNVYDVWQVHGVDVVIARQPRPPDKPHIKADAILTDQPGLVLMMRFADCVPIFLYDPIRRVAGIVHAGWLGTVLGAALASVQAMQAEFGSAPANILAGIGPSIGPDHYEVGADVVSRVRRAFGIDASGLLAERDGRTDFNLWAANRLQLERAGVKQIETAGLCTACHTDDWFSHRAEHGRTGRFGALIGIN